MSNINLWESNFSKDYIYFNSVKEYINYLILQGKPFDFKVKDKYDINSEPTSLLEKYAFKNKKNITYTDQEHVIAFSNASFYDTCIDPEYFEEHKDELKEYQTKIMSNLDIKDYKTIRIHDTLINQEELLSFINSIDTGNYNIIYQLSDGKELSKEIIDVLNQKHIKFEIEQNGKWNTISSNIAINNQTFLYLLENESIQIKIDEKFKLEEIDNLKYLNGLNNSASITFNKAFLDKDDRKYFSHMKEIIEILSKHNKQYNITISVNNRQILRESKLLENPPSNIRFNIYNYEELHTYDYESYMSEEDILNKLVEPIKSANLSPLERYIAAYNIVKNFKQYKEKSKNSVESRYLRYILYNDYLVCFGFAGLLTELLNRLDIPSYRIDATVDLSYDNGYTLEEKNINFTGHSRSFVKIDDDKYGVHGVFLGDATWDNDLSTDLYLNSLLTFDRKKEARRLEGLTKIDVFFDCHNKEEFINKINVYLNRLIDERKKNSCRPDDEEYIIQSIYKNVYSELLKIFYSIDYDFYLKLYSKCSIIDNYGTDFKELNVVFNEILNDICEFSLKYSNKNISFNTIIDAASVVKRKVNGYNEEQLNVWKNKTIKVNEDYARTDFPYIYDPNNPKEAYLESRAI